jgi:hypothetical protein
VRYVHPNYLFIALNVYVEFVLIYRPHPVYHYIYPGSRILIFTHPGSGIPDPKTAMKDRGEKKFVPIPFFGAINFTKLNFFIFEMLKKKIWANFQRIVELFTQKLVTKHSKIWVWDPGSGKNPFRIPDPGVKKAPDPGSGSATLHYIISNVD